MYTIVILINLKNHMIFSMLIIAKYIFLYTYYSGHMITFDYINEILDPNFAGIPNIY